MSIRNVGDEFVWKRKDYLIWGYSVYDMLYLKETNKN